jgi:hypothetical protein
MGIKNAEARVKPKTGEAVPTEKPQRSFGTATLRQLYAARTYLGLEAQKELGVRMPVEVYFKDPRIAEVFAHVCIGDEFTTP